MVWTDKFKNKPQPGTESQKSVPPSKIVKVTDYVSVKNISFFHAGPSKQQVLGSLIGSLDLPDPSSALKAILAREEAGSTAIAPGLALPHARIPGITRIAAAIGICPSGVIDPKAEGGPIYAMVLFLGPTENMKEHLAFLACVSALFQAEGLLTALTQSGSPESAFELIRQAEKSL